MKKILLGLDEQMDDISEQLRMFTKSSDMGQLFSGSMAVMHVIKEQYEKGGVVVCRDKDGHEQLLKLT